MSNKKGTVCGIVLAAGRGRRMGSEIPKQYLPLAGRPVLYYSLKAFEDSEADSVILVTGEEDIEYCRREIVEAFRLTKVRKILAGGAERYESVEKGLRACEDAGYVLIHDGARPLITPALINENIACVREYDACVTAVPSKDTVKTADPEGFVADTPDRSKVWIIQTPQSFSYDLVRRAYDRRAQLDDRTVTDDAMVVEKYGNSRVKLLQGDYRNIKLTTPEDLSLMEAMIRL